MSITHPFTRVLRFVAATFIVLAMMTECSRADHDPAQNFLRVKFTDRTVLWRPCRLVVDEYPWRAYATAWCDSITPELVTLRDQIFQSPFEPGGVIGPGLWTWEVNDVNAPSGAPPAFSGAGCRILTLHMGVNTSAQLDCTP